MQYGNHVFNELSISDSEIYLAMGYRGQTPEKCILDYVDRIREDIHSFCQVQYLYDILEIKLLNNNKLDVQGKTFAVGKIIFSYLENVTHVSVFIATAGKEYDDYLHRIKDENDIVKEFVADSIGSVIAEACVKKIGEDIKLYTSLKQTLPYSPGYCGWNIKEQKLLFELFPQSPCGVFLNSSYLMSPVKSISGIIGLGENLKPKPYHCELCTNINCYKRNI